MPTRPHSTWHRPPRLRIGAAEVEEGNRHATWLELFYDLVFVVAVAALAHRLIGHLSLTGFLAYAALFVPVWWTWVGAVFYADRFDSDDPVHRLLVFAQMVAVVALAATAEGALAEQSAAFALAYAAARGVLVVMYLRAYRHVEEARPLTRRFALGFTVAALFWAVSALVPAPYRFGLWAVGLAVDFATPITAGTLHARLAPHEEHLPERFGLFTIIVLGESVVAVAATLHGVGGAQLWTAFLGLALAFGLWWLYFEQVGSAPIRAAREKERTGLYQLWLYAHLPLTLGLAAAGAGTGLVIASSPGAALPGAERWLVCGSVALCFAGLGLMSAASSAARQSVAGGSAETDWHPAAWRFGATALALVLAAFGGALAPWAVLGLLVAACAVGVAFDQKARLPVHGSAEPPASDAPAGDADSERATAPGRRAFRATSPSSNQSQ